MSVSGNELGELLIDLGLISPEQLSDAIKQQKRSGERLTIVLSNMGLVSERQLKDALELQFGVNFVNLSANPPNEGFVRLVPEEIERKYCFVPVSSQGTQFTVAMVDPDDLIAADAVRHNLQCGNFKKLVCTADDFEHLMRVIYHTVPEPPVVAEAIIESVETVAPAAAEPVIEQPAAAKPKSKKKATMHDLDSDEEEFAMFGMHKMQHQAREQRAITTDPTEASAAQEIKPGSDGEPAPQEEAGVEQILEYEPVSEEPQAIDLDATISPQAAAQAAAELAESAEPTDDVPQISEAEEADPTEKPQSRGHAVRQSFSSLFGDEDDDDMFANEEPAQEEAVEPASEAHEEAPANRLLENILEEADALSPAAKEKKASKRSLFDSEDDEFEFKSNNEAVRPVQETVEVEPERFQAVDEDSQIPLENFETAEKPVQDFDSGAARTSSAKKLRSLFDDEMEEGELFDQSGVVGGEILSPTQRDQIVEPESEEFSSGEAPPSADLEFGTDDNTSTAESLLKEIEKPYHSLFDDDVEEDDLFSQSEQGDTDADSKDAEPTEETESQAAGEEEQEAYRSPSTSMAIARSKRTMSLFDEDEIDENSLFAEEDAKESKESEEADLGAGRSAEVEPVSERPSIGALLDALESALETDAVCMKKKEMPEPAEEVDERHPAEISGMYEMGVFAPTESLSADLECAEQEITSHTEEKEEEAKPGKPKFSQAMLMDLFSSEEEAIALEEATEVAPGQESAGEKSQVEEEEELSVADAFEPVSELIDETLEHLGERAPSSDEKAEAPLAEPIDEDWSAVEPMPDDSQETETVRLDPEEVESALSSAPDMEPAETIAETSTGVRGKPLDREVLTPLPKDSMELPPITISRYSRSLGRGKRASVAAQSKSAETPVRQAAPAAKADLAPAAKVDVEPALEADLVSAAEVAAATNVPLVPNLPVAESTLVSEVPASEDTGRIDESEPENPPADFSLAENLPIPAEVSDFKETAPSEEAQVEEVTSAASGELPAQTLFPEEEPAESISNEAVPQADVGELYGDLQLTKTGIQRQLAKIAEALPEKVPDAIEDVLANVTNEIIDSVDLSQLPRSKVEISFLEGIIESELRQMSQKADAPHTVPPALETVPNAQPVAQPETRSVQPSPVTPFTQTAAQEAPPAPSQQQMPPPVQAFASQTPEIPPPQQPAVQPMQTVPQLEHSTQPQQTQPAPQPVQQVLQPMEQAPQSLAQLLQQPVQQAPQPQPVPQPVQAYEPAPQPAPAEPISIDDSIMALAAQILTQAVNISCSEVQFEPLEMGMALRFVSGGELLDETVLPREIQEKLIVCLKSITGLDVSIVDRRQDTNFVTDEFGSPIEMRVMSIPGMHGEIVAVSLLPCQ